ncbi:Protein transport protein Sec31A [Armadillidium vulgare]|nr:Protein transport protein Sec31A [Armadillidium vulgare]
MKVKELSVAANISWSPDYLSSTLLACGTSTQQLDASFSSSSVLQLYDLNQKNSTLDMKLMATTNVAAKFNKVLWNGKQCGALSHPSGIIAGGCDNGSIYLYSPDKMLRKEEPLVAAMEGKHAGAVYSLDFNHHQPNLLATGSKDCEIIIWDINDTSSPMTPGAKPTLTSDVTAVAWNRKVEHIMASTYAGRCVVYDLRKSTSIAQIAESVSRIKAHTVRWHPTVATQLILCSDDDATPFGQVWDLRFVASPLKSLEGHQRGIVTSSWCLSDSDLYITSGKDNKILVWNPNNNGKLAEIVGEFPSYNQWSFDLAWCNKDPSLVAASSIDGTVSVYSILGAGIPPAQSNKFSAIADSFPGMEMPIEVPQTVQPQPVYLKRPPQWFPKRSGASFGFGGRLLSWNSTSTTITISQIITEPEFVSRSTELEEALSKPNLNVYCQAKAQATNDPHEKAQEGSTGSLDQANSFEMIASAHSLDKTPDAEVECNGDITSTEQLSLSIGEDSHGLIRHALLIGDYESAVKLCLKEKNHSYALILAAHAGVEIFNKTRDSILRAESQNGLSALITSIVQRDLYCLSEMIDLRDRLYRALGYQTGSSLAASRTRTLSSSSQPSYRRSSTPLSYQPPQFTPSVQAQQASYATGGISAAPQPVSTSFYSPAHIAPKQKIDFF